MPLGARRAVEELARLLDGAAPEPTGAAAGQVALIERVRAVTPVLARAAAPTPAFRTALRTRLVAVASVQPPTPTPTPTPGPARAVAQWSQGRGVRRRLGVTAGTLAGVIALTGIGVAGSRSLPGAPLYGLKRGAEEVQLALAGGDVSEATRQLQFARTRLREVAALTGGAREVSVGPVASAGLFATGRLVLGGPLDARLRSTLADMDRETRSGYRLLAKAYRRTSRAGLLRQLTTFSTAQRSDLTRILPALPAGARQQAAASLALVTVIGDKARALLEPRACPTGCPPTPSGSPHPGGRATTGPAASHRPAPGRPTPATRAPASHAPVTRVPIPIRPPSGHSTRPPGGPHQPGPHGNGRPPTALPTPRPVPPAHLPTPPPVPPEPLPTLPIPSVLPLPVPVPVPTELPTVPPLLP